ncbi:hypothetical protein [Sphingobacterium psychroaquaticum]|uniref:Uncharacterized protein n=1 Tax=Sphingobacterium psychroaquaticum TaxID=561061 RepID=A0A1X7JB06_9SPHI|nr:hypothetical protein [Sphingobacterium psychroaquaticum]SMG24729.1 hypothetical protein SAMN05660862_1677 [Sphingobacterium psychroaquaticum]
MILKYCKSFLVVGSVLFIQGVAAQSFSGVDDLGRVITQQAEVGSKKANKQVGIFYFLWQGDAGSPTSEKNWDLTKIYQDYPEVFHDFHHPNWGGGAAGPGKYYFWGEPIYGYYRGDDYWVHLKNIQLLADAQVDFLVLDATNRLTYPKQVKELMRAMMTVRKQGKPAPKIVFYTNTASGDAMQEIYDTFYSPNAAERVADNWYYLDGKPLIIGLSKEAKGRTYEKFFTIRESQWPNEPEKVDGWPWIEFQRPQKVYTNNKGKREIVNVSASQHPNLDASMGGSAFYGKAGNWGRSFRNNNPGNPDKEIAYGYNIQEQWDFAISQDVPFVFITGWNEWIAGKWSRGDQYKDQAHFVDQANAEYSRDIEPSWTAGLKDNYYLQMISNIRRYKGTDGVITIDRSTVMPAITAWNTVKSVYVDYVGDVIDRNHPGAQSEPKVMYTNRSGRNDLENVKLLATDSELGFYVQTANRLTERTKENWMTLWLNTDENYRSGWYGYDFRVIQGERIQRFNQGAWQDIGKVSFEISDNAVLIKIPNSILGLPKKNYNIEFKWSDNMQKDDPLDWYVNGDTAPGGRLNLTVWIK